MRARYVDDDPTQGDGDGEPAVTSDGRPWPDAMENDSWDSSPDDGNDRYQGRRRAPLIGRRRLAIPIVVVAVAGAIALATSLWPRGDGPPPATATPAGGDTPAASAWSSSVPPRSPDTSQSPAAPAVGRTGDPGVAVQPPFPAVTVEAEAGSLSGSARVEESQRASGGRAVGQLGDWGDAQQEPGSLRISNLSIPATGTYQIAIYFANSEISGPRTAVVSVSGTPAVTLSFAGGPKCCGVKYLEVRLAAGLHTITISNPTDIAPSIDRLVVSLPS